MNPCVLTYNGQAQSPLINIDTAQEMTSDANDNERENEVKDANDKHPYRRPEHMLGAIAVMLGRHIDDV